LNFATVITISLLGVLLYYVIDIIESRVVHKLDTK
jgi:NitT/TauT family transport system permease protein